MDAPRHRAPDFLWRYQCNQQGCCCGPWTVGLSEPEVHRLQLAARSEGLGTLVSRAIEVKSQSPFAILSKGGDGRCVLLTEDARCVVHAKLGEEALPTVCQSFPVVGTSAAMGLGTSWDLLCPEVANALASASAPAAITSMPEAFSRAISVAPSPGGEQPLSLSATCTISVSDYRVFVEGWLGALRDSFERPLLALAEGFIHLQGVGASEAETAIARPGAEALIHYLHGEIVALAQRRGSLGAKVPFARRFLVHHAWESAALLDRIEAGQLADAEGSLAALSKVDTAGHRVLTNYLIMKIWQLPLDAEVTLYAGLSELLRRLATGLYLAGALARDNARSPGVEVLVTSLAFADVVYRLAPPPSWPFEVPLASVDGGCTGRLSDLQGAAQAR